jgi:uncharacterized membrane protein YedE/YeeE
MTIDWNHFTPWAALGGGVLLGLASALFMLVNGRILGISGILGGLLGALSNSWFHKKTSAFSDAGWRLSFLAGLAAAPWLLVWLAPASWIPQPRIEASTTVIVMAGLLVGLGTRYGSGCTSGHGVCGLSRLSPRSLAATLCFMAGGFLTVYVVRHLF